MTTVTGYFALAAAQSSGKALWYLTRSSGIVAMLLLTLVVVLGTLGPIRISSARWPRFAVATLHRDLSLLAVAFVAVHVASTVTDGFAPITWLDAVVPFGSGYRPLWLGLGALAFDLMLALILTSLVRGRLGYPRWRRIHWLAYACWPVAVFHGLGTGSDAAQPWMLAVTAACTLSVALAAVARIHGSVEVARPRAWLATSAAIPATIAGFALIGPLQANWALRAGTPASLLRPHPLLAGARADSRSAIPATSAFTAILAGRIRSRRVRSGTLIDLSMALRGEQPGLLRIRLAGRALRHGGISLAGSQVDLEMTRTGTVFAGEVVSLHGTHVAARVAADTGAPLDLVAVLRIDGRHGIVRGRLTAVPVT